MKKPIIIELIIWVIILTIIFTVGIFAYSKIFIEPNIYKIQFKDIDGITVGSPVRFMGINVGYARNLKAHGKHVDVQIIITNKNMKIPNGTVARVEFYGLGGSKSIELMPPDGSCDVGILTEDTIRINDVTKIASGLVDVAEEIEKYIKGLDKAGMQKFLETIKEVKTEQFNDIDKHMKEVSEKTHAKMKEVKIKQHEMKTKIEKFDENIDKINEFIKK